MRWPFTNWLRGAPGRDGPAPDAAAAAPLPEPDPGPGPRVEARPAAWRDLPAVQRTIGAVPLTAPIAAFARDLATRDAPDTTLRPLGHDVTADGPVGLVSGIAAPLVQRVPSGSATRATPALPSPAAPGRVRPTSQPGMTAFAALPRRGGPDAGRGPASDPRRREEASAEARTDEADGGRVGDVPEGAVRALPVARLATATPGIAVTRVADGTAPPPALAMAPAILPGAPPEIEVASRGPVASAAVVADVANPAEPAPVARPDVAVAVPPDRGAAGGLGSPVAARRTLGESRRLGLGAPLVGPPPSAAREPGRSDLAVARRARSADAAMPTPELTPARPVVLPAAAGPAPIPRLVVARRPASSTTIAEAPDAMRPIASLGPRATRPVPGSPTSDDAEGARAADGAHDEPDRRAWGDSVDSSTGAPAEPHAGGSPADGPLPARPLVGSSPIVARLALEEPATDAEVGPPADGGASAAPRPWSSTGAPDAGSPPGAMRPGSTSVATVGVRVGRDTSDPAGSAASGTVAARGAEGPIGPAGPSPAAHTTPGFLPVVAARAIGSTSSVAGIGHRPAPGPLPVVARLASVPADMRGADGTPSPLATSAEHRGAPSAAGAPVQREARPIFGQPSPGSGRGSAPAALSTLPLVHATLATAATPAVSEPGAIGPDRSDRALRWTPAAGFTSIAATPGPFVQRAVEIDEVAVTAASSAASAAEPAAAGAGQAGPAGPASAAGAGTDYEELAEHLYDRIRSRLTSELLLDRERSGTLVDA